MVAKYQHSDDLPRISKITTECVTWVSLSPTLFIYKAEVIEHPFPPEMGVEITCANTIIYEMSKFCMAIIFQFYNISSSIFAVILILARCFQLWR